MCACSTVIRILPDFCFGVKKHLSWWQMSLSLEVAPGRADVLFVWLCYLAHGGREKLWWYIVAWIYLGEMEPF